MTLRALIGLFLLAAAAGIATGGDGGERRLAGRGVPELVDVPHSPAAGAVLAAEGGARLIFERTSGDAPRANQARVRPSGWRTSAVHSIRDAHQRFRFATPSALRRAGLESWHTATPPPSSSA